MDMVFVLRIYEWVGVLMQRRYVNERFANNTLFFFLTKRDPRALVSPSNIKILYNMKNTTITETNVFFYFFSGVRIA